MTQPANAVDEKSGITMVPRMLPRQADRLLQDRDGNLQFNIAAFQNLSRKQITKSVRETFAAAQSLASGSNKTLNASIFFGACNNDFLGSLSDPELGDDAIKQFLLVVSDYQLNCRSLGPKNHGQGNRIFPAYDMLQHPAVVRYGNVELRAIENFLFCPDDQKRAIANIARYQNDETRMYAPSNASGHLAGDDAEWNLRRLMTNAGFYLGPQPDSAWEVFEDWATRYIGGLRHSHLSWHNGHAYYYLRIQRELYSRFNAKSRYIQAPDMHRIYNSLAGKNVLFVSPLAHIVQEQASSGRLRKLYTNFEIPAFSLRAIPAWVSTWPNRPHTNWSETFGKMCDSVVAAHREIPFDVFIASCGCYGIPICDFVRTTYGCPVLYVGNFAHVLFGIHPSSQEQPRARTNPEMWAKSDLGRYKNLDRVDGGRYT